MIVKLVLARDDGEVLSWCNNLEELGDAALCNGWDVDAWLQDQYIPQIVAYLEAVMGGPKEEKIDLLLTAVEDAMRQQRWLGEDEHIA